MKELEPGQQRIARLDNLERELDVDDFRENYSGTFRNTKLNEYLREHEDEEGLVGEYWRTKGKMGLEINTLERLPDLTKLIEQGRYGEAYRMAGESDTIF